MLATSTRDWCHATISWEEPRLIRQIDELSGFNKHRIKYSAFVFGKDSAIQNGVRIIESPSRSKTGIEALVCAKSYYGPLVLPKKHRRQEAKAFEKSKAFDAIICSPELKFKELGLETACQSVTPSNTIFK